MTDASTSVSLLPVYQAIEPFLIAVVSAAIPVLLTWLLAQLQTRTNLHVSDQARAVIQQAATNAAGRILAAQEGNLANVVIDVHSPLVAAEIPKVTAAAGNAINQLGVTPDRLRDLITAKVGLVQASAAPAVSAAPSPPISGASQ